MVSANALAFFLTVSYKTMTKTALELTHQDWQRFRPSPEHDASQQQQIRRRHEEAWRVARKAARLLHEKYRAQKVVAFGSLTRAEWFSQESDIDLAAWGIPSELFYRAVAELTGLSAAYQIDLVDAETCHAALRAAIESEGVEL